MKLNKLLNGTLQRKRASGTKWDEVKAEYSPAVVAIEMSYPRPFSYKYSTNGVATGFIVDKANGIILTNKHVVTDGPIRAKAKFLKNEEINLLPIYRDPTHDYAFFRFDPTKLTHTKLTEIPICADKAVSGERVLVMGNNAGEKLTYVDSTLGQTNRTLNSPIGYNTFFISATDITVPGSSGGPVLNDNGEAVGMTCCGITETNSSYYLPLQRVVRALRLLRRGLSIPRGTLQIAFAHETFQKCVAQLGVSSEIVDEMRSESADAEGMLVVNNILPKGPGYVSGMRSGDILRSINGCLIYNYVELESILDDSVNKPIEIRFIRDGKEMKSKVKVQDLYGISPDEYIEVSNAVVHRLEYPLALYFNIPAEGVFIAHRGYMFSSLGQCSGPAVITGVGSYDTPTLDDFQRAIESYPDGSQVAVRFFGVADKSKEHVSRITVDKRWHSFVRAKRNDKIGGWDYETCGPRIASTSRVVPEENTIKPKEIGNNPLDAIVYVNFTTPFPVDGMRNSYCVGVGIVVDAKLGLVICERMTIPTTLGDIFLTFNSAKMVKAKAVFVHPFQEFALIQYNTSVVASDKLVQVSELEISDKPLHIGESLEYYGIDGYHNRIRSSCAVTKIMGLYVHASAQKPDFIPMNTEYFLSNESVQGIGGVYVDKEDNTVRGFNFFFTDQAFRGIRALDVLPYIEMVRDSLTNKKQIQTEISLLPVQLDTVPLVQARETLNLDDEWAEKLLAKMDPYRRSLLTVSRIMSRTDAQLKFRENDIILAINGKPLSQFSQFTMEVLGRSSVSATVLRNNAIVEINQVATSSLPSMGTQRIIIYAGMVLQSGHSTLKLLGDLPNNMRHEGVYITSLLDGSPAQAESKNRKSELSNAFITAVNNKPVRSLDTFLEAVSRVGDNEYVRLTTHNVKSDKTEIYSIRVDQEFWKTRELRSDANGDWEEVAVKADIRKTNYCLIDTKLSAFRTVRTRT